MYRLVFLVASSFTLGWFASGFAFVYSDEPRSKSDPERDLVTQLYRARDGYQSSLERLREYYKVTNNEENQYWAEKELTGFHMVIKNPYILDMDLPSPNLKPTQNIPKANRIFKEAIDWMNKTSVTGKNENYKRAELLFRRLIRDYPDCDKVDEACYYLGDIYSSKYFMQYRRAVAFYERVWLYEPNTNLDARIKAAQMYDRYLDDNRRAVELYQEVLRREFDPNQTKEARKRLDSLLGNRATGR